VKIAFRSSKLPFLYSAPSIEVLQSPKGVESLRLMLMLP
jgi:hypothetical protein